MKPSNDKVIELIDEGFVAAGKRVDFPIKHTKTWVALTDRQAQMAEQGHIRTMTVAGNSLEGVGIYDGDKVLCKKVFNKKEIKDDSICIVFIPSNGEVVAKKVRFQPPYLRLISCNDSVSDIYVNADDVEIRGIVIGLVRMADNFGRFDRGYTSDIPF